MTRALTHWACGFLLCFCAGAACSAGGLPNGLPSTALGAVAAYAGFRLSEWRARTDARLAETAARR